MDIGIDIEEVQRFQNLKKRDEFILKNFTKNEIEYAFSKTKPAIHLCGFFSAKEALLKTVNSKIPMKNIEIIHNKKGKPKINILKNKFNNNFKISISHTDKLAIAQVLRSK